MCVTNTINRRPPHQPASFSPSAIGVCPNVVSQRPLGSFASVQQGFVAPHQEPTSEDKQVNLSQKARPRRRRKPQKPGKTAKMNDRHFVVHNYHDHANDIDQHEEADQDDPNQRRRGGVSVAFPVKLHAILDQVEADGLAHVVSWKAHGRCFVIHDPKEFVDHIMPRYFRQTKLTSFQRQLSLYGFSRLTRGADAGGYYHELSLRGKPFLCKQMTRTKVKGTRFKAASSPEQEPDFYTMNPVVLVSPSISNESSRRTDENFSLYPKGVSSVYERLSFQYSNSQQAPPAFPKLSSTYQQQQQPITAMSAFPFVDPLALTNNADRVLDEVIAELMFREPGESDSLDEFVHDWDPSFNVNFGGGLQNDAQLGFMLERLMED